MVLLSTTLGAWLHDFHHAQEASEEAFALEATHSGDESPCGDGKASEPQACAWCVLQTLQAPPQEACAHGIGIGMEPLVPCWRVQDAPPQRPQGQRLQARAPPGVSRLA